MELKGTALLADANLQAYYRLEADGTDDSPNGYDVVAGTVPDYVAGKFGNGADFEASSSQYLSIADASCPNLEISGSQTWGAWVKAESISADITIIGKDKITSRGRQLVILSTGKATFEILGLTPSNIQSDTILTSGNWYFVVGRYDGSNLEVFVNGTKKTVSVTGTPNVSTSDFSIGCRFVGGGDAVSTPFDGIIDDAFVFNRALTDAEVTKLYTTTSPAFLNNLISYKNN